MRAPRGQGPGHARGRILGGLLLLLTPLLLGCEKLLKLPDPDQPWNQAVAELSGRSVHQITLAEEHRVLVDHIHRGLTDPIHQPYFLIGVLGCALWSVAYVLFFKQGIRDKIHTLPALAICLNFTWEAMAVFVLPNPSLLWTILEWSWFLIDIGLLGLLIRYAPAQLKIDLVKRHFLLVVFAALVFCFLAQLTFVLTFGDLLGFMVAFVINLVMSIQFVFMFFSRRETRLGQSLPAAWLKMCGTACTSVQCAALLPLLRPDIPNWGFMYFLYVSIFAFDVLYVLLLSCDSKRTPA